MPEDQYYEVGYISSVRKDGQVTLFPDVDYPGDYEEMESVLIEYDQELVPFFISECRLYKEQYLLITFEELTDPHLPHALKGCRAFLPVNRLPDLGPDNFYYHEIIGFSVYEEQKGFVGKVKDVYEMPQQDVMALDYHGQEVLVPLHDQFFRGIEKETGEITVTLPEGFLDIYLK